MNFGGRPPGSGPVVLGHRGASRAGAQSVTTGPRAAPSPGSLREPAENTLAAFEEASAQGAVGIELDVRVAATGEVVVFHDPTLERLTGGLDRRSIALLSGRELSGVTLSGGEKVPLLAEVLAMARSRGLGVNVEMKRDAPSRRAVVSATARLLRGWDPRHPVLVSSFDPWMLAAHRALAPRVPIALLVHRSSYHEAMLALGPAVLPVRAVHIERTLATAERIEGLHRRGYVVNVWTVNDAAEARAIAGGGADGLITDVPALIRSALGLQ